MNIYRPGELAKALALLEPKRWMERYFPKQLLEALAELADIRAGQIRAWLLLGQPGRWPYGPDDGENPYTGLFIQGHFPDRRYRILLDGTVMVDRWLLSRDSSARELLEKAEAAGFQPWG